MKIDNLPKETGFKVPQKDYFNQLPQQIQNRVQNKKTLIFLGFGLKSWSYAFSLACLSLLAWGTAGQFLRQNITEQEVSIIDNSREDLADFSDEFLDDYLLESDISTEELFATLDKGERQASTNQDWKNELLEDLEEEEGLMSDIDEYLLN